MNEIISYTFGAPDLLARAAVLLPWAVIIIAAVVVWGQSTVGKIGGEDWEP